MKKAIRFFIILFVLAVCFSVAPFSMLSASAATEVYYVVDGEDVMLCDNSTGEAIFVIPDTYYLLREGESVSTNYYFVSYNGISGKVLKTGVKSKTYTGITSPYYISALTIAETGAYIRVYTGPSSSTAPLDTFLAEDEPSFEFIGTMADSDDTSTNLWYYVRYNTDEAGYVLSSATSAPTLAASITPHPNSLIDDEDETESPGATDDGDTTAEPTNNLLRVLLILGISVPAVVVVFLLFRPSGKQRSAPRRERDYYDRGYEDDYEEDDNYYADYRDGRYNTRDYRRRR